MYPSVRIDCWIVCASTQRRQSYILPHDICTYIFTGNPADRSLINRSHYQASYPECSHTTYKRACTSIYILYIHIYIYTYMVYLKPLSSEFPNPQSKFNPPSVHSAMTTALRWRPPQYPLYQYKPVCIYIYICKYLYVCLCM